MQRDDGVMVAEHQTAKDKALERVSWQQWLEANMLIMSQLIASGTSSRDYMSYTVMVSQLAQKYEWVSVLRFDREYRKKQANTGRPWGADMPMLRDVILVPKDLFTKQSQVKGLDQASNGPKSNSKQRSGSKGKGQGKNYKKAQKPEFSDEMKICWKYNNGTCTFGEKCRFSHFCSRCGLTTHGKHNHPN